MPLSDCRGKKTLEVSGQPPIKLVSIGSGQTKLEVGNETVLFRHEEKFHHPCGIGFIIEDNLPDEQIIERLKKINTLHFERIGQQLNVNLVAISHTGSQERFIKTVDMVSKHTDIALTLISPEITALNKALKITRGKNPLIYKKNLDNLNAAAELAKEFNVPLVVSSVNLETLFNLTKELNNLGITDLVLDTGAKPLSEKIWELTQIRRLALKRSVRGLGYPVLAIVDNNDPYEEAMEAATYIAKYAGIVLIKSTESWETLSLLTLRQNIYTDPQKPLQIEPKLYPVGQVNPKSPVLVTTNFSLSYYTVLSEVEASKLPAYILSVDTEGMSVLTAWAAEKFTPDKIADSINKFAVRDTVSHTRLIIPGYVAVLSGELEDKSNWQVIVGPKEASGIPSFLKNL